MTKRVVAVDTETCRFGPGLMAPPLVCVTTAEYDAEGKEIVKNIYKHKEGTEVFRDLLKDPNVLIVGQNIAYDMGVFAAYDSTLLPLIFDAYRNNRISDTKIREQLLDIAAGRLSKVKGYYSLSRLAQDYLGIELDKETWRTGYGKLKDVPLNEWPEGAKEYALTDAVATLQVWWEQRETRDEVDSKGNVTDEFRQTRTSFVFQLMSIHGLRTDPEMVPVFKAAVLKRFKASLSVLVKAGVVRVSRKEIKRSDKTIAELIVTICNELQIEIPRTEPTKRAPEGNVKKDAETIEELVAEMESQLLDRPDMSETFKDYVNTLTNLAEYNTTSKLLGTYIPVLEQGVKLPINPGWNVLVDTGRSSCGEPNLQNLPRDYYDLDGKKQPGVRDCFIPRPGYYFCSVDYNMIELCALAQYLEETFGHSEMAELIKDNKDLHCRLGSEILGIGYEDFLALKKSDPKLFKDTRGASKAGNFGLPGGMGDRKFVVAAKKSYGVVLTMPQVKKLRTAYKLTYPEMAELFRKASRETSNGTTTILTPGSGRPRGNVHYTQWCNHTFQAPVSDGAKDAGFDLAYECYVDRSSPLFGSRLAVFVHDEWILEHKIETSSAAAKRQVEVQNAAMARVIYRVPIRSEPALMKRWLKDAEAVYNEAGDVVVYEQKT